jgi:hypothetical protein
MSFAKSVRRVLSASRCRMPIVKAYQNILYSTKIQSVFDEIGRFSEGSPDHVRSFVLNHWPAEDTVCKAKIEADGGISGFKRVAKLDSDGVQMIDLDEDFGLWIGREEIFEMAEVEDDHKPAHRVPKGEGYPRRRRCVAGLRISGCGDFLPRDGQASSPNLVRWIGAPGEARGSRWNGISRIR